MGLLKDIINIKAIYQQIQLLMKKPTYPASNEIISFNYEEIGKSEKNNLYLQFTFYFNTQLKSQNKTNIFTCSKLPLEFDKSKRCPKFSIALKDKLKLKVDCPKE